MQNHHQLAILYILRGGTDAIRCINPKCRITITCTEVAAGALLKWNVSLPRLGDVCRYPTYTDPCLGLLT
jgi:hypothetical protein